MEDVEDYPNDLSYRKSYEGIKKFKTKKSSKRSRGRHSKPKFTRKARIFIFIILVFVNILVNMDHGTVPAANDEIQRDLDINETILGLFGSLVFFGNLIGKEIFYVF